MPGRTVLPQRGTGERERGLPSLSSCLGQTLRDDQGHRPARVGAVVPAVQGFSLGPHPGEMKRKLEWDMGHFVFGAVPAPGK